MDFSKGLFVLEDLITGAAAEIKNRAYQNKHKQNRCKNGYCRNICKEGLCKKCADNYSYYKGKKGTEYGGNNSGTGNSASAAAVTRFIAKHIVSSFLFKV